MDRSRCSSYRGLEHYLGRNAEVAETQVDDIYFRLLRWSLSVWRSVGTSRGIKELDGTYVRVGK